jgi:hypothetical protein
MGIELAVAAVLFRPLALYLEVGFRFGARRMAQSESAGVKRQRSNKDGREQMDDRPG